MIIMNKKIPPEICCELLFCVGFFCVFFFFFFGGGRGGGGVGNTH